MSEFSNDFIEKIKEHVPEGNPETCWTGDGKFSSSTGYGQLMHKYKNYSSHRLVYLLYYNEIPENICVLHKCDNRKCVNPHHLFLGTRGDNNRDRSKKGRSCQENNHPLSKLNQSDVEYIRQSDKSQRKLAKEFGVCKTLIANIKHNRTWRKVDEG